MVAQQRLESFTRIVPRFQALRRLGVNSRQMVRAAGPPAILYGCEIMGVSDSVLLTTRSRVARAAAPQAGGKSPDMVLQVLDGPFGTLDPAFQAHGEPIKMWACAWWNSWFPAEQLMQAFAEASIKVASTDNSWWGRTAGPVAALIATMDRIGWTMPSAREIVDDLGMSWWFDKDSPAAIVKACHGSVRRWRLKRIGKLMPGLVPEPDRPDIPLKFRGQPTRLVDFSYVLAPLVNGRGSGSTTPEQWNPKWKGDLASACSAGQWTQLRRAQVPDWKIDDQRCQLCLEATGTLEHRFLCRATTPQGGWPLPPSKASLAVCSLGPHRLRLLQTRGMLVLRIPVQRPKQEGDFFWLLQPSLDDPAIDAAVWYFDGSMLNGKWLPLRSTGFGIAVVSKQGKLLGCGRGSPPHWCATAAAAEAWALQEVLAMLPFPPEMRTDCQALLKTLAGSPSSASATDKQLARIWVNIANSLGGCFKAVAGANQLVWMPAHTTTSSVGEVKLSNGRKLTMLDWRANRLVDALAKMSALEAQYLPEAIKLIKSAEAAVRYAAMLLGRTTHAANNHTTVVTDENGKQSNKVIRDAMPAPQRPKRRLSPCRATETPGKQSARSGICEGSTVLPPPLKAPRTGALCSNPASARKLEQERLKRRVDDIASTLSVTPGKPSASDRIAALRQRVGIVPPLPPQ